MLLHMLIKGSSSRILVYHAWPWYSKFNFSNSTTTILHSKNRFKVVICDESCTVFFQWIYTNLWISVKRGTVSLAILVRFPQGPHHFCHPSAILCGTEPVSALTLVLLYCCTLYNFFLGFRQWRSCADRILTLNMHILSPLFWSIGVGPGALAHWPRLDHMCWPGTWQ